MLQIKVNTVGFQNGSPSINVKISGLPESKSLSQADSPIMKFGQPSSGALMSMGSIDNLMDGKRHVIIR